MTYAVSKNGTYYIPRTENDRSKGFLLSTLASASIMSGLAVAGKPFSKQLFEERANNYLYKDKLYEALKQSGLEDKGVKIIPAQFERGLQSAEARGTNACFIPIKKEVLINTDKISIAGFHELGHAMNNLMSKYGVKYLAKMRHAGYAIAGLMEYFAIFSRTKPKGEQRNLTDFIEDNCGKIAFAAMLPVVAEEAIASYRGIKLAKNVGLESNALKSMKKLYGKALLTYAGRAVLGGLAVGASRMIMDYYTRPIKQEPFELLF